MSADEPTPADHSDDAERIAHLELEVLRLQGRLEKVEADRRTLRDRLDTTRERLAAVERRRIVRAATVAGRPKSSALDYAKVPVEVARALFSKTTAGERTTPTAPKKPSAAADDDSGGGGRANHAPLRVVVDGTEHSFDLSARQFDLPSEDGTPVPGGLYLVPEGAGLAARPESGFVVPRAGHRYATTVEGQGVDLVTLQYAGDRRVRIDRRPAGSVETVDVDPSADRVTVALWAAEPPTSPVAVRMSDQGEVPLLRNIVLMIGAMKAGTTTLWNYLIQHPDIHGNRRSKEPGFFSSPDNFAAGPVSYALDYDVEVRGGDGWALDASTHYTKYPTYTDVPERISTFPATFRFIYLMRHPIDRIESHLAHAVAMGYADPETVQRSVDYATNLSRYAMQLDRYHEVLDDPQILLLDFGHLARDPIAVCRRVEDFLGLEHYGYDMVGVRNQRRTKHRADRVGLSDSQRRDIGEALRPDVERLRTHYGFEAAASWEL